MASSLISLYEMYMSSQSSPSMPLYSAWQKAYQSASTMGGPHLSRSMWSTFTKAFDVHSSSSQRQLTRVFPDNHFRAPFCFRLSFLKCSRAPAQGTNIKGALIVNLDEFTQVVRPFFCSPHPSSSQYSVRGRLIILADSPTTLMH